MKGGIPVLHLGPLESPSSLPPLASQTNADVSQSLRTPTTHPSGSFFTIRLPSLTSQWRTPPS